MKKSDLGLIGLAVMGENLVMNMESKGFTVSVFNRTTEKVERFVNGRAKGKNIVGCYSLQQLVDSLEKPRKIMMMIKAGKPVDDMIEQLLPLLDDGDIIIDGGNSHFPDTMRRCAYVESKGKLYIGTGVSGGEEGALNGPSMMPGGSPAAWAAVKPIFQSICAKVEDGTPCCDWVGENGAGHFVKMVHNGIEYGDMELICETYSLLKNILGLVCDPVAGLVEIPCIKRNAGGVGNALVAAELALAGVESHIPADEVIVAMKKIGDTMSSTLKETAEGGLAVTPTGKKLCEKVFG